MFHDRGVRDAVRREYPIAVLQIGAVIAHFEAKKVCKAAASFLENYLRSAGVPKLGPRARVDVDVARPVSNEPDL